MKSYSKLNLLQNKLTGRDEPKSLLEYFFTSKYSYVTFTVPYYDYIRGEVFIDDLRDVMGKEVPLLFDLSGLINLLYEDFLTQIKKGTNLESMANFLVNSKSRYINPPMIEKRVIKEVNTNLFSLETVEDEVEEVKDDEPYKKAEITIRLKSSAILRGEVFLHDLSDYMSDDFLNIEELFTVLYLDFINKIRENGNTLTVMKAISKRINS